MDNSNNSNYTLHNPDLHNNYSVLRENPDIKSSCSIVSDTMIYVTIKIQSNNPRFELVENHSFFRSEVKDLEEKANSIYENTIIKFCNGALPIRKSGNEWIKDAGNIQYRWNNKRWVQV